MFLRCAVDLPCAVLFMKSNNKGLFKGALLSLFAPKLLSISSAIPESPKFVEERLGCVQASLCFVVSFPECTVEFLFVIASH